MKIFVGSIAEKLNSLKSDKVKYTKELKKLDRSIQVQTNVVVELYQLYTNSLPTTISNIKSVFQTFINMQLYNKLNEFVQLYYDIKIHNNTTGEEMYNEYYDRYHETLDNEIIEWGWPSDKIQEMYLYQFMTETLYNVGIINKSNIEDLAFEYLYALYHDISLYRDGEENTILWLTNNSEDFRTLVKIYCYTFDFIDKYNDDFINCYNNGQSTLKEWEDKSYKYSSYITAINTIIDEICEVDTIYYSDTYYQAKQIIKKTNKALNEINSQLQNIVTNNNLDVVLSDYSSYPISGDGVVSYTNDDNETSQDMDENSLPDTLENTSDQSTLSNLLDSFRNQSEEEIETQQNEQRVNDLNLVANISF